MILLSLLLFTAVPSPSWTVMLTKVFCQGTSVVSDGSTLYFSGRRAGFPKQTNVAIGRVSVNGTELDPWLTKRIVDAPGEFPPALMGRNAALSADGLFVFQDGQPGQSFSPFVIDSWGPVVTDGTRWYTLNCRKVDGPALKLLCSTNSAKVWLTALVPSNRGKLVNGFLVLAGGRCFVSAAQESLPSNASGSWALEAATGKQLWHQAIGVQQGIAVYADRLFLHETDGLACRRQDTGELLWKVPQKGGSYFSAPTAPVITTDGVITSTWEGQPVVRAHQRGSGLMLWETPLPGLPQRVSLSFDAAHERLYACSAWGSYCLSALDGSVIWHNPTAIGLGSVVGGKLLLVMPSSITAYGLEAK